MKQVSTQARGALCWWWFMGDAVVTGKNIWTNVCLGDIRTEKRVLGYTNKRRRVGKMYGIAITINWQNITFRKNEFIQDIEMMVLYVPGLVVRVIYVHGRAWQKHMDKCSLS